MAEWQCQRSGECCQRPDAVVMTQQEWAIISETPQAKERTLTIDVSGNFVALRAGSCPFYDNGCTIYSVRPTNCRRFCCFRMDVKTEHFEDGAAVPAVVFKSRDFRRQYQLNERKAMKWGVRHGWTK